MEGTTITEYPKYSVTKEGTVWSNAQLKEKKLKPRIVSQSKKGYLQVSLYNDKCKRDKNGKLLPKQIYIHHLVWTTFNGEIPEDMEIDHIDDNPRNNHIDNLQLVNRRSNMIKFNRIKWGRLTQEMVKEIKELKEQGVSTQEIADKLGKSYTSIWRVLKGKRQISKSINGKKTYYLEDYEYGV